MNIRLKKASIVFDGIVEVTIYIDGMTKGSLKLKEKDIEILESILSAGVIVINDKPLHEFIPTTSC